MQVAKDAPTIAAKLKQAGTVGQLVPFGNTQLQILPDAAVGPTNGFVGITDHDVQVADGNDKPYFHDEAYGGVVYRIYTMQFPGNPGVLVRVAQPVSDAASTQTALGWLLAALVPAGAIGAAVVARLAAGRVLRPVGRLTETVERIRATGDLSAPIETPGRDEISRLGQAFAAMTAALDESVGAQRRLVADASHELRTPLTSLITNLELLAEQPDDPSAPALAAAALAEAGELRVLINDLVELARDGQASFHIEDVRLDLVAERVAARAAGRAPGLRYELDCRPTLVRGDPDALERAIGNLVDNALKWSPPDGRIRISAAGGTVEVSDDGPGIPADDLPYIFDRFYRSAQGAGTARLGPRPRDRAQDRRHARRNRRSNSAAARGEIPHQRAGDRRRSAPCGTDHGTQLTPPFPSPRPVDDDLGHADSRASPAGGCNTGRGL